MRINPVTIEEITGLKRGTILLTTRYAGGDVYVEFKDKTTIDDKALVKKMLNKTNLVMLTEPEMEI